MLRPLTKCPTCGSSSSFIARAGDTTALYRCAGHPDRHTFTAAHPEPIAAVDHPNKRKDHAETHQVTRTWPPAGLHRG
jgi:hypothetical protein